MHKDNEQKLCILQLLVMSDPGVKSEALQQYPYACPLPGRLGFMVVCYLLQKLSIFRLASSGLQSPISRNQSSCVCF